MNILVIGGGGREHAIVDVLSRSKHADKIYCAPGNAGIAEKAECVPFKDTDVDALLRFAEEKHIYLTVVGPEAALAVGIVDRFRAEGLTIFGHTKAATRIESSKEFAKQLMEQYHIPTAAYRSFDNYKEALAYVQSRPLPAVIKYDGLAAGKGVIIAQTLDEAGEALRDMLLDERFGQGRVVIEDFLQGPEFSFMCFVNGNNVYPMPLAQDHKRAFDADNGLNTGGMGAYTPLPFITADDYEFALHHILEPAARAMVSEGCPLTGVLYGGLMKTKDGIKVIEFNARFGDPETEVVLPLLQTDAVELFYAIAKGENMPSLQWSDKPVIGVVMASNGYPNGYKKDFAITIDPQYDGMLYHMGTRREGTQLLTNGGRVLMVISTADTLDEARRKVYRNIEYIHCDNLFYRRDI